MGKGKHGSIEVRIMYNTGSPDRQERHMKELSSGTDVPILKSHILIPSLSGNKFLGKSCCVKGSYSFC